MNRCSVPRSCWQEALPDGIVNRGSHEHEGYKCNVIQDVAAVSLLSAIAATRAYAPHHRRRVQFTARSACVSQQQPSLAVASRPDSRCGACYHDDAATTHEIGGGRRRRRLIIGCRCSSSQVAVPSHWHWWFVGRRWQRRGVNIGWTQQVTVLVVACAMDGGMLPLLVARACFQLNCCLFHLLYVHRTGALVPLR